MTIFVDLFIIVFLGGAIGLGLYMFIVWTQLSRSASKNFFSSIFPIFLFSSQGLSEQQVASRTNLIRAFVCFLMFALIGAGLILLKHQS